jgi:PadR family transcriptional regulator, regulatory protein AphA
MITKRINKTRYSILGALSFEPMSGYDIKNWLSNVTGAFWSESDGQIYPTLAQLLKDKLVSCLDDTGSGNRPRKVYSITKEGLRALKQWLIIPAQESTARSELILKLFYGKNLSKKDYIAHLERQQKLSEEKLEFYLAKQKHIQEEHNSTDAFYWLQTIRSAIYHAKADVAWCKDTLKVVTKEK